MHTYRQTVQHLAPRYPKPAGSMSTRQFARRLCGAQKRPFSTSTRLNRPASENGGGIGRSTPGPGHQGPRWSGRSVAALTATAGMLGWGIAATTLQQAPPKHRVMLFDSKTPKPEYATIHEMEDVGSSCSAVSHPLLEEVGIYVCGCRLTSPPFLLGDKGDPAGHQGARRGRGHHQHGSG